MGYLPEFLDYLHEQLRNGSIYVWGAQGQNHTVISDSWIRRMETSERNADRAIAFWRKRVAQGKGEVLRAFDCSGLIMYFLQNLKGIYSYDMSSNTLKGKCRKISKQELLPGDFVFRVYTIGSTIGRAYHIGVVVDKDRNVIEDKGRDDGVVKRHIDVDSGYWNYFGRPDCFREEIEGETPIPEPGNWTLSRVLKRTSPLMKGEDVRHVQEALILKGYPCGERGADGQYGTDTENAVRKFQENNGIKVDGIVGKDTCERLGGIWQNGSEPGLPPTWTLSRLLKRTSPIMKGDDVRHAQEALIARGYPCGERGVDAQFGDGTEKAVRRFQEANRLTADGIIGRATCETLGGTWKDAVEEQSWTLSRLLKRTSPIMKGDDVRHAQESLIAKGYPCGSRGADGAYGDDTEKAVERFQQERGLTVDGIIGKNTCEKLGGKWRG